MNLCKLIVHELRKESGNSDVRLITSNQLMTIEADSVELVNTLLKSYTGDKILYAEFDRTPGKFFPNSFDSYRTN